jgi:hypothetical protein
MQNHQKKRREATFFNTGFVQGVGAIMASPVRIYVFACRYEVRTTGASPEDGGKASNG